MIITEGVDPRAGTLTASCVWVIFIRSRQSLTEKTLSAKIAICNFRRDLRDFNVLCLCLHDSIYSPYFWFSHVNLDGRNNSLLVLIIGIKLKSMWPKYGIWDYSIYCLLLQRDHLFIHSFVAQCRHISTLQQIFPCFPQNTEDPVLVLQPGFFFSGHIVGVRGSIRMWLKF